MSYGHHPLKTSIDSLSILNQVKNGRNMQIVVRPYVSLREKEWMELLFHFILGVAASWKKWSVRILPLSQSLNLKSERLATILDQILKSSLSFLVLTAMVTGLHCLSKRKWTLDYYTPSLTLLRFLVVLGCLHQWPYLCHAHATAWPGWLDASNFTS